MFEVGRDEMSFVKMAHILWQLKPSSILSNDLVQSHSSSFTFRRHTMFIRT